MAKLNFYLRDQNAKEKTSVFLFFYFHGERVKWSTGIKVHPKHWNIKNQRVREVMDVPDASLINSQLTEYDAVINKVYSDFNQKGIYPTAKQVKNTFLEAIKDPVQALKEKGFWEYFDLFVEEKKLKVVKDVVKDYDNSLRKHLRKVEEVYGLKIQYNMLKNQPDGFIDKFEKYLTYEAPTRDGHFGLATNTVGKQFKNLKAYLNWCFAKSIIPPFSLKHIVTKTEEVDKVFLNEDDLNKLAELKIESPQLDKVRDLFLVGCETALRYSDFTNVKPENIQGDDLIIRHQKTNNKVIIPISKRLKGIIEKYDKKLPTSYSVYQFNVDIRKLCEEAGIDQEIVIYRKRGNESFTEIKKKFELVSSHTCRRSFCTNKFLKDMPAEAIMKFSGHKSSRAFMRYLRLDSEVVATKFRDFF